MGKNWERIDYDIFSAPLCKVNEDSHCISLFLKCAQRAGFIASAVKSFTLVFQIFSRTQ